MCSDWPTSSGEHRGSSCSIYTYLGLDWFGLPWHRVQHHVMAARHSGIKSWGFLAQESILILGKVSSFNKVRDPLFLDAISSVELQFEKLLIIPEYDCCPHPGFSAVFDSQSEE